MRAVDENKRGEDGLVAIIVATIVMIIMTLVTLGFARLMQREQRQALDQSLGTQAFYAAESGINDVVQALQSKTNPYTGSKPDCNGPSFTNGVISTTLNSSYTCLIVNPTPATLEYSPGRVTTSASTTVPLHASDGSRINTVKVAWDQFPSTPSPALSTTVCSSSVSFPSISSWPATTPGIIRLDLVPSDTLQRDALVNGTLSIYLYPAACGTTSGNVAATMGAGGTSVGQVVFINCDNNGARRCEATIDTGTVPNIHYFLRMRSLYHNSSVTVKIFNGVSQLNLSDAQTEVDSTGKVNDVIRRIQVRVPNNLTYPVPDFAVQSMDSLCKQVSIAPPASVFGIGALGSGDIAGNCSL